VIEFIEECRQEWKRLGVPDPIANEMAIDLTADIEEAEAEGGSAEDVLGTSLFDPRRFAAAWAGARGVTAPPALIDRATTAIPDGLVRTRSILAMALTGLGALFALAGVALVVGRHSSAVAAPVSRILEGPGPARLLGPAPALPSMRFFMPGPGFAVQSHGPIVMLAIALLLVGLVGLGLGVLYWFPWSRRDSRRRFGRTDRPA
jgi:hypothetical protein